MNRRRFFAWLGGTAAGFAAASTLDLDRLLWIPGERSIFIPEFRQVGNTFISPEWVTREAMAIFTDTLDSLKYFDRLYERDWRKQTAQLTLAQQCVA